MSNISRANIRDRIYSQSVFGFVERQKNDTFGVGYKQFSKRNLDNTVLRRVGDPVGK